jgi:GAF domain-containing protein
MSVVGHTRLLDALTDLARSLVEALEADGCAISRVLGDVLLLACQATGDGRSLSLGQGHLVSEYPETLKVLEARVPYVVCFGAPGADPGEERMLLDLGYRSLLMLPLELHGEVWGLVEVYRTDPRPFGPGEIRAASALLNAFG